MEPSVYIGTQRRANPAEDYSDLLDQPTHISDKKADLDLKVPLPDCHDCNMGQGYGPNHICSRVAPKCVDCGEGTLQWAEGGFVPWHRICDVCGSHWDLHPGWPDGYYQRARFYG